MLCVSSPLAADFPVTAAGSVWCGEVQRARVGRAVSRPADGRTSHCWILRRYAAGPREKRCQTSYCWPANSWTDDVPTAELPLLHFRSELHFPPTKPRKKLMRYSENQFLVRTVDVAGGCASSFWAKLLLQLNRSNVAEPEVTASRQTEVYLIVEHV